MGRVFNQRLVFILLVCCLESQLPPSLFTIGVVHAAAGETIEHSNPQKIEGDNFTLIQSSNNDGEKQYLMFGSNGVWATSPDLYHWTDFTAHGDFNGNGNPDEPNDTLFGFRLFNERFHASINTVISPFKHGYYRQLIKQTGKGLFWTSDANQDGVVGGNFLNKDSTVREFQTIGLWSPSVVNLADGKYHFYFSHCNVPGSTYCGDGRAFIGMATSDNIDGPYEGASVIMQSGNVGGAVSNSYLGYDGTPWDQATSPTALMPYVFLDKEKQPWMVYGLGAGGIWITALDKRSGLPVDVDQEQKSYGRRIAGGNGLMIEGSSIFYSKETDYYYLILTNLGVSQSHDKFVNNLRVARAKSPQGPYIDGAGNDLSQMVHSSHAMLPGSPETETVLASFGNKLLGSYVWRNESGVKTSDIGELSPANASVLTDKANGKLFLVFDANITDVPEQRFARVHEIKMSQDGWPLVLPLPYEPTANDGQIKSEDLVGEYQLIIHTNKNDLEPQKPHFVRFNTDGSVTGELTGKYSLVNGDEFSLILNDGNAFKGVVAWQSHTDSNHTQITELTLSASESVRRAALWARKQPAKSDNQQFEDIYQSLKATLPTKLTHLPLLPQIAARGAKIHWSCESSSVINLATQQVFRPGTDELDKQVELFAVVTLTNGNQRRLDFSVTIPASRPLNLLAHFAFDENLDDSLNPDAHGVLTGVRLNTLTSEKAKFTKGKRGKALVLDGNGGVNFGQGLLPYKAFTLSYWMKPTALSPTQPSIFIIPTLPDGAYNGEHFFGIYNNVGDWSNTITVWNRNGSDDDWPFLVGRESASLNEWQHIALACDAGNCELFINGQPSGKAQLGMIVGDNANLALGVNLWDKPFEGSIDDLRIYDEALSGPEIRALDVSGTSEETLLSIAVTEVKKQLIAQNTDAVKSNLLLKDKGPFQSKVRWYSNNPDVISINGTVHRPQAGSSAVQVTLQALVSLNGDENRFDVPVTVLPIDMPKKLLEYSFDGNLYDNQMKHSSDTVTGAFIWQPAEKVTQAIYHPGIKGEALYLDGSYGAILAKHLRITGDFTISVWLKPEQFTVHTPAWFLYDNPEDWVSLVPYNADYLPDVWSKTNGQYTDRILSAPLLENKWVNLIVTSEAGQTTLYRDGMKVNQWANEEPLLEGRVLNLSVGVNFWDPSFKGLIDELVVYKGSVAESEAKYIYTSGMH